MIIYLPGFSPKNIEEITGNIQALEIKGHNVKGFEWKHWSNADAKWSLEDELSKVLKEVENEKELIILCKSIGTFVAANLLQHFDLDKVKKIIVMGLPVLDLSEEDKKVYLVLNEMKGKVSFIQNTKDSHGTPEDLNLVIDIGAFDCHFPQAESHTYFYPELITQLINEAA